MLTWRSIEVALFLVTGAAGFIGSALVRELVSRGERVRALDNFHTGKLENILEVLGKLELLKTDILDRAGLFKACEGVDYVLHHAALPLVPQSVDDPLHAHEINLTGTLNVLLAARTARVKRVVYAGSSAVYGENEVQPKMESMVPEPLSPYAIQKLAGEHYMRCFSRIYGLETVCLRYFNIFGPRQSSSSPYSGVIARFVTQMLEGKAPTVFGDGENTRDFTYIENVVQANLLAVNAPSESVVGRSFNIGTGQSYSLNTMLVLLRDLLVYHGKISYAPSRIGDVRHSCADISQAQTYLKYKPEISLETGLKKTVDWYKTQL
jgi:nucleoside-diphosphate-sugar epimerase